MKIAVLVCLSALALADNSAPDEPACKSAVHRGIERAFAEYCRTHPGRGIHGSCNDWLRAFRGCNGSFTREASGWKILIRLFDCHDPVIAAAPEGKNWRVTGVSMKSYMPMPRMPELELAPSPSPAMN